MDKQELVILATLAVLFLSNVAWAIIYSHTVKSWERQARDLNDQWYKYMKDVIERLYRLEGKDK